MKNFDVEFVYDGQKETAHCDASSEGTDAQYEVTPHNKKLLEKYGKTIFRQSKSEYLSGEPIIDLEYYSALKEGLENHLFEKK